MFQAQDHRHLLQPSPQQTLLPHWGRGGVQCRTKPVWSWCHLLEDPVPHMMGRAGEREPTDTGQWAPSASMSARGREAGRSGVQAWSVLLFQGPQALGPLQHFGGEGPPGRWTQGTQAGAPGGLGEEGERAGTPDVRSKVSAHANPLSPWSKEGWGRGAFS